MSERRFSGRYTSCCCIRKGFLVPIVSSMISSTFLEMHATRFQSNQQKNSVLSFNLAIVVFLDIEQYSSGTSVV
ncbi:unnamed protein product [Urochloa humidicola]